MIDPDILSQAIELNVAAALAEDVGEGDISAQLIPAEQQSQARLISREPAIVAGKPWVDAVFAHLDPQVELCWQVEEGTRVEPNQCLFELRGSSRSLLTGERSALNFLQLLSATATACQRLADQVAHTSVQLLDTRKTLPGLRIAQKYAVTQGGCFNHRIGLYDAFLIKENHIMACGSITQAVVAARDLKPGKPVEIEVESLAELNEALEAGADIIMLDNFSLEDMRTAVVSASGRAKLEASGGITADTLVPIAETGVDYISIGAITKDVKAIDLSMRFS